MDRFRPCLSIWRMEKENGLSAATMCPESYGRLRRPDWRRPPPICCMARARAVQLLSRLMGGSTIRAPNGTRSLSTRFEFPRQPFCRSYGGKTSGSYSIWETMNRNRPLFSPQTAVMAVTDTEPAECDNLF